MVDFRHVRTREMLKILLNIPNYPTSWSTHDFSVYPKTLSDPAVCFGGPFHLRECQLGVNMIMNHIIIS